MSAAVDSIASRPLFPFPRPTPLEPAAGLAALRAEGPVARVRLADDEPAWLVTRYDDARAVLSDHRRFALALPGGGIGAGDGGPNYSLFQDPPGHTRLRRLVTAAFTARRVAGLRARTAEIAGALAADMAARGRPVDLMESFAFPFPLTVLAELLGVPEAERDDFRVWSGALMSIHGEGAPTAGGAGWGNLAQQVSDLIARKRREPGDDLFSALITARDTDRLSLPELVSVAITLIIAGSAAISVTTAIGVVLLTRHDRLAALAADPALAATAVDEVLRFQSATGDMARVATEDVELAGERIRVGDKVVVSIASSNRDERRFTDPDRFDVTRADNVPMTFGHGIHYCLGAALARMELQVVFTTFAERYPGLRVVVGTDELAWHRSEFFGDEWPETLPVTW